MKRDIWKLDKTTINMHYDFEFLDLGTSGLEIISIGAVLESMNGMSRFYGINTAFFKSKAWFKLIEQFMDKDEQATWMFDNVFKQILVRFRDERYTVTEFVTRYYGDGTYNLKKMPLNIFHGQMELISGGKYKAGVTESHGNLEHISRNLTKNLELTFMSKSTKNCLVRPWAYYNAHDHVCLCNLYGGFSKIPEIIQSYSFDLRAMTDVFGLDHDSFNPVTPHHPLIDAIGQHKTFLKLEKAVLNAKV